jgi:hypothetical protein
MEVGVIGCCEIAMFHIPFILSDSKSGISGVCDGDRSRAHSIAGGLVFRRPLMVSPLFRPNGNLV